MLGLGDRELETRGKCQSFFHGEICKHYVVLHHVTCVASKELPIELVLVVKGDGTGEGVASLDSDSITKSVQKRRFTGSRRAHYESQLARQAVTCAPFEYLKLSGRLSPASYLFTRCSHRHRVSNVIETELNDFFATLVFFEDLLEQNIMLLLITGDGLGSR